ncbi:MAG TPA: hypothetical protein VG605_24440, partial [Puia sp.]|nr:hypothetical protein [Puia sp.]
MKNLVTILSLLFFAAMTARAQVPSSQQPQQQLQTQLSNNQRRLKAKQDSARSTLNRYIQPGKKKTPASTNTLAPAKPASSLARVDSIERREPQKFMPSLDRTSCKAIVFIPILPDSANSPATKTIPPPPPTPAPAKRPPFLQIHGNVLYNLNYYSRIDTPYNEQNIYVHTIQTWLDVLVKGEYPFRIFLTNHFSNSSLFRNYSDLNFSYNNNAFAQMLRDQIRRAYLQHLPSQKLLDSLQRVLKTDWQKLNRLQGYGRNPSLIQKAVEDKEAAAAGRKSDSARLNDDILDSIRAVTRHDADSLQREIDKIERLLQLSHQKSQFATSEDLAAISKLDNPEQVRKELPVLGLSDSSLPKGYKALMAVKSFSVGRSVVNYSELSARNISVNGVQAEYNPNYYYAVAVGTIDYRFRDFVIQQPNEPHQYLDIFRIGKGLKNGNNVILTFFNGRRQLYGTTVIDSPATVAPATALMGMTLEGNYHLTKNILFTGEVAKSSSPGYNNDTAKGHSPGSNLFGFGDRSNEAWSIKGNAFFPETQTRIKAAYKHLAVNYQSFSIFTDGSAQTAWSASIDQLLFKKQLDLMVGANTNDFNNPLISQEYRSTTVFKSIQATFRRRNWPVLSLGYFPSSQITKLGNSEYTENLFYTLVGNSTWSYQVDKLLMNTTVIYTQFYNKAADSGFTYFNTRNLTVSQTAFLDKFTLQLNASAADNDSYQLYTLEGKAQHTIGKILTIGAGIKYNMQTVYNIDEFGYSAEAGLKLNKLGQIQFSA